MHQQKEKWLNGRFQVKCMFGWVGVEQIDGLGVLDGG